MLPLLVALILHSRFRGPGENVDHCIEFSESALSHTSNTVSSRPGFPCARLFPFLPIPSSRRRLHIYSPTTLLHNNPLPVLFIN